MFPSRIEDILNKSIDYFNTFEVAVDLPAQRGNVVACVFGQKQVLELQQGWLIQIASIAVAADQLNVVDHQFPGLEEVAVPIHILLKLLHLPF